MNVKHYATSKFFARPPPPEGRNPKGGGGRSHMYLNPDTPSAKRSEPALLSRIVKSLRPLENVASCQNAIACCRAGKIVRHARGRALKLCDARAARRLSDAIGMIRATALAPQPPETQKKHPAHDKKTGCVPARCGLSLILRPGSAPPPFPAASRPQARPASPRRTPKSLRAPDFGKIRPKKISNADFGGFSVGAI